MSCPVRLPYLPSPARRVPTLVSLPHLDPAHLNDNVVVLDIECGPRLTTPSYKNVPILITLTDYHGHVIFNAGVQPPGGLPCFTEPHITGLAREDVATFPSFETVYPYLRFLSTQVVILGDGLTRTSLPSGSPSPPPPSSTHPCSCASALWHSKCAAPPAVFRPIRCP